MKIFINIQNINGSKEYSYKETSETKDFECELSKECSRELL